MSDHSEKDHGQTEDERLSERLSAIICLKPFFSEKVSIELGLDKLLLESVESDQDFVSLIQSLEIAKKQPHEDINMEQCKVETRIIGFLLRGKIKNKDREYLPEGFRSDQSPLLAKLEFVAKQAYSSLS